MLVRTETFRHAKADAEPPAEFDRTYLGVFTSTSAGTSFSANVTVPAGTAAILVMPAMLTSGAEDGGEPIDLGGSYDSVALELIKSPSPGTGGAGKPVAGALGLRNPTTGSSLSLALSTDITINTWAVHVWALVSIKATEDFWGMTDTSNQGSQDTIASMSRASTVIGSVIFGVGNADSLAAGAGTAQGDITDEDNNDNVGSGEGSGMFWLAGIMDAPTIDDYNWQIEWPTAARRGACLVEIIPV